VYVHDNDCNRYEISRDGKGIDSCQLKKDCPFSKVDSICKEYFPEVNGTEPRFPEGGKQCFFKESLYPLVPWPKACKIFQAGDICNTYEISDEGNYVASCDIAMVKDECLAPNTKTFECLEFCPNDTCIKEYALKLTLSVMAAVLSLATVYV